MSEPRKPSGTAKLEKPSCPHCKGTGIIARRTDVGAPLSGFEGVCKCCKGEGEVSLPDFQKWIGEHPEDA